METELTMRLPAAGSPGPAGTGGGRGPGPDPAKIWPGSIKHVVCDMYCYVSIRKIKRRLIYARISENIAYDAPISKLF